MKRSILLFIAVMMAVMLSAKTYQVTASKLNVRNAPETGAVVGSLAQGAEVEVVSIKNGWAEIKYKGKTAYISAKYITPVKKTETKKDSSKKETVQKDTKAAKDKNAKAAKDKNTKVIKDKKDTKTTKEVEVSSGLEDPVIAGFHATWDMLFQGRNVYTRIVPKGEKPGAWEKRKVGAKGDNVYGAVSGFGFEYNGIVKRLPKANIMFGFRTGIYYDWCGALGQDVSLAQDGSLKGRWSMHSVSLPLQPTLSFEWHTPSGYPMGLGIFTGPIFNPYFMQNWVVTGTGGFSFTNYVTGHYFAITGENMPGMGTLDPAQRCNVFSCLWGTGVWFQLGRTFRLFVSTDWEIDNYVWQKGGTGSDGSDYTRQEAHLNRFITAGFQIVINKKKKKSHKE